MLKNQLAYQLGKHTTVIRELSDDELEIFNQSTAVLYEFANYERLIGMFQDNYDEFYQVELDYLKAYKSRGDLTFLEREHYWVLINRRFNNWLSSLRIVLDHIKTKIVGSYGKESKAHETLKEVLSENYDNHFGYRFIYHLRNYSQHLGMPIGSLNATRELLKEENKFKYHVEVFFYRDEFLRAYTWDTKSRKRLEQEILKCPEKINSSAIIIEMVSSIEKIHQIILKVLKPSIDEAIQNVLAFKNEFPEKYDKPILITENNEDFCKSSLIPFELAERFKKY